MESLTTVVNMMKSMGLPDHRVYCDLSGTMDTLYHEYEVESLDGYFTAERGIFVDMDADTQRLVDHMNDNTVNGRRDILEILI